MIDFSQFDSFIAMTMYFNNEAVCRNAIVETRWGIGEEQDIVCPYCGQHHCATRKDGKFRCNHCKRNFTCKVGTIFEDSNLSLVKWFIAMYLISSHKKGISSCQWARNIKVTQKTAWYMPHKVRSLLVSSLVKVQPYSLTNLTPTIRLAVWVITTASAIMVHYSLFVRMMALYIPTTLRAFGLTSVE